MSQKPNQPIDITHELVRVVRSDRARDGYILRHLASGKIGFLALPAQIRYIEAGQIWAAELTEQHPTYFKAALHSLAPAERLQ